MSESQISEKTKEEWLERAIALLKSQNYREALKACERASQIDSTCSRAYHGMGLIYTQIKDYKKAFNAYERALRLDPSNVKIAFDMGEFYFIVKDYKQARIQYKKAIRLDGRYERFYRDRVRSLVDKVWLLNQSNIFEDNDKVIVVAFKNVLLLDPSNAQALAFLLNARKMKQNLKKLFLMNVLVFMENTLR